MEPISVEGYGCAVSWDGETLRARGTNKAAHFALMGPTDVDIADYTSKDESNREQWAGVRQAVKASKPADELVLRRGDFKVRSFKVGNPFVNGTLVLETNAGRTHQLHFRRKHNADFEKLASALS